MFSSFRRRQQSCFRALSTPKIPSCRGSSSSVPTHWEDIAGPTSSGQDKASWDTRDGERGVTFMWGRGQKVTEDCVPAHITLKDSQVQPGRPKGGLV